MFECILFDDRQTYTCYDICDKYQKTDKSIRVIHKKNGGLSAPLNAVGDIAKGALKENFKFCKNSTYTKGNI